MVPNGAGGKGMKDKTARIIGIVLLVIFVICTFFGAALGETDIVAQKATQICMECIGIG